MPLEHAQLFPAQNQRSAKKWSETIRRKPFGLAVTVVPVAGTKTADRLNCLVQL